MAKDRPFNPEDVQFTHELEQFTAAITKMASIAVAYMNAMVTAGFTRGEALTLTVDYMRDMRQQWRKDQEDK